MKIYVKKTAQGLKPVYESDYELYKKLKMGEDYSCEIKRPRNYEFHKKFFAMVAMAYDNQEEFNNVDRYRKYLTMKAGYYTSTKTKNGGMFHDADSISFGNMDQVQFEELFSKVMDVIIAEIGIKSETIMNEIVNYM